MSIFLFFFLVKIGDVKFSFFFLLLCSECVSFRVAKFNRTASVFDAAILTRLVAGRARDRGKMLLKHYDKDFEGRWRDLEGV